MNVHDLLSLATARLRRQRWKWFPPAPSTPKPTVSCVGPSWFRRLVADECDIVADEEAPGLVWAPEDDVPAAQARGASAISNAFVSATRAHPGSRRRLPRATPESFLTLDDAARAGARVTSSADLQECRAAQIRFREAHARSLAAQVPVLDAMPHVTVVCVSRRPELLPAVLAQFEALAYPNRSLAIFVTTPVSESQLATLRRAGARVEDRVGVSLGACLNEAIDTSDTPLFAKWDDDDRYGPEYLGDLVYYRNATRATVTGKNSCFAYMAATDTTHLRFPGQSCRDASHLAGGTFLIDLGRLGEIRFPCVDLGEDHALLRRCRAAGRRIYAADPFNYVQVRNSDNTWTIDSQRYLEQAVRLGEGMRLDAAFV